MQSLFRSLAALALAALAGVASARITFFDAPRFGGRQFTIDQAVSNFADARSGRRVSGSYPYGPSPHWSGPR